jgi:tRNA pseudouridine(55) synthase
MISEVYNLYKPLGWTPLQALEKFRELRPELKGVPMTYAGRLDPMAEGVLVVLAGEQAKNREEFLSLDKVYEAKILFGFETDTGDVLGLVKNTSETVFDQTSLKQTVQDLVGEHEWEVPLYSSVPVNGKPLFEWGREGKPVLLPKKKMKIYNAAIAGSESIGKELLQSQILKKISQVQGDFRQKEIGEKWNAIFDQSRIPLFNTVTFSIHCASGTYVRSLVSRVSEELGLKAVLYSLVREKVGHHGILDALRLSGQFG